MFVTRVVRFAGDFKSSVMLRRVGRWAQRNVPETFQSSCFYLVDIDDSCVGNGQIWTNSRDYMPYFFTFEYLLRCYKKM